ncbi:hypothetical protein FEQ02_03602 [Burkholderia pseudomultivorans]|nr:hypothetical protein [Burkholderia pseudomultivorans]
MRRPADPAVVARRRNENHHGRSPQRVRHVHEPGIDTHHQRGPADRRAEGAYRHRGQHDRARRPRGDLLRIVVLGSGTPRQQHAQAARHHLRRERGPAIGRPFLVGIRRRMEQQHERRTVGHGRRQGRLPRRNDSVHGGTFRHIAERLARAYTHPVPRVAIGTRAEAVRIHEACTGLAEILRLIADAAPGARQRGDDRALVYAVQVDDRVVPMRAQRADRRRDRLQVADAPTLLELAQRRAQHRTDARMPAHHFRARLVHGPVDRHAGKGAMEIVDDGQRLDDIAQRRHFHDEDAFHVCGDMRGHSAC